MRKAFLIFPLVFLFFSAGAQQRTHLPYSIFGLGEINSKGLGRNLGMGKSGFAMASDHYLNNLNPASYHQLDSISFFFDFGLGTDIVKYETSNELQRGMDVNIRNIVMGFKISKRWSSSFGIIPFSTVGYKIKATKNVEGTQDVFTANLAGTGGLSQFYWDNCFVPFKHFSIGASAAYVFGTIEQSESVHYYQIPDDITSKLTTHINKVLVDFGAQYYFNMGKNYKISLGAVFGNTHNMNYKQEVLITQANGLVFEDNVVREGTFKFPMYFGGGIAVDWSNNLTVSADYLYRNWAETPSENTQFEYVNTNAYRFGAEYIPGRMNQYGFIGRIAYRAGYYHEDYYITINGNSITENGFSAGFGIPFLKNKTTINLSYYSGVRGSIDNGLIRERYNSIMVSLSLHDWWFLKSKYD